MWKTRWCLYLSVLLQCEHCLDSEDPGARSFPVLNTAGSVKHFFAPSVFWPWQLWLRWKKNSPRTVLQHSEKNAILFSIKSKLFSDLLSLERPSFQLCGNGRNGREKSWSETWGLWPWYVGGTLPSFGKSLCLALNLVRVLL